MKCPEQANAWRHKVNYYLPRSERREQDVNVNRQEGPFGDDENALKLNAVDGYKTVDILKVIELYTLNG